MQKKLNAIPYVCFTDLTIFEFLFSLVLDDRAIGLYSSRAAVVHLNLRAGLTFPVPVCTVSPGLWVNKADTQWLTRSDCMLHIG